jgi:hypothetical protein
LKSAVACFESKLVAGFTLAELMFLKSTPACRGNLLIPSPPLFGFYR